ncbi:hypothetical protein ABVT39_016194 [Epinephelus coioides]
MSDAKKKCCSQCGRRMAEKDNHDSCVLCLGQEHAELALGDPLFCLPCSQLPVTTLRHRAQLLLPAMDSIAHTEPAGPWADTDFPPLPPPVPGERLCSLYVTDASLPPQLQACPPGPT